MTTATMNDVVSVLDSAWSKKSIKIDWLEFEQRMDLIFHSCLTVEQRNLATMELLDATTRRGHFDPKNYLTTIGS